VSRTDLIPEFCIATATVVAAALVQWGIVVWVRENAPLVLFAASAAALTFWRGLGPGMLASSLGTAVGSGLFIAPLHQSAAGKGSLQFEALLLFAGSMVSCLLIYRLRADREDSDAVHERRDDALAFVAHELRQPLSNIKLASAILERDQSEENRTRATTLITRSAARLGRVIDDLADVTRLQRSSISVDRRVLRLQDAVLAAAESARPEIEHRLQTLEVDVPVEPPLWVSGDAVRLQQVFANLLSNACKYSPEGAEISIACRAEHGRAHVMVRDTGLGIRADMLESIFDLFVREGSGGEGLGIGLTLARDVVSQHGGNISAHSNGPGQGSRFLIDLPLVSVPLPRLHEAPAASPESL
jgi:signal transduction histidine kinase